MRMRRKSLKSVHEQAGLQAVQLRTLYLTVTGLLVVALVTVSSALLVAPSAEAIEGQKCYNDNQEHGDFGVLYNNQDGSFSNCYYNGEYYWLAAIRDGTARGVDGRSHYNNIVAKTAYGVRTYPIVSIVIRFHGQGRTGYVETTGGGGQRTGWLSSTKLDCEGPYTPNYKATDEGSALRDFIYHVGEVAKTNSPFYAGPVVHSAQISAAGGNRLYYTVGCGL